MAKKNARAVEKPVDEDLVKDALAKAVATGDIVDFRLLFAPFSPARKTSVEVLESEKYAYLRPDASLKETPEFNEALLLVRDVLTWAHIQQELDAKRPSQLPSVLLLPLGDNAVRVGKYTSASQAYELLRVRRRMQGLFLAEAGKALDAGDVDRAVNGYIIGAGLAYDYAAFPEPLPLVPNHQTEALKLHGAYPRRPEDCVAFAPTKDHAATALEFLLGDSEAAEQLAAKPLDTQVAFLTELVRRMDLDWESFAGRYGEAVAQTREYNERLEKLSANPGQSPNTLEAEIEEQLTGDLKELSALLLGRTIPDGEWWQYLKELAFEHPAAVLFVSRQLIGDKEIIMPRYRPDSPLPKALGLVTESAPAST
jgi:hypothetical protein